MEKLLTGRQVADIFNVDQKSVARWGNRGLIESVRTPGGHHRYPERSVRALLEATRTGPTRVSGLLSGEVRALAEEMAEAGRAALERIEAAK